MKETFASVLKTFAAEVTQQFALAVTFSPEDQLKAPVKTVLKEAGKLLQLEVNAVTEVRVDELGGRPDIGVTVAALLSGYVELKAPGKGARPEKLKGADKTQWQKFRDIPNLLYTDGNEWGLYQNGKRVGNVVRLAGDVTADGSEAVNEHAANALFELLREFLKWEPLVPSSPRALAKMLAPVCRLLRSDVLAACDDQDSALSALAQDWRQYLFPDADNKQFADAYAQTLTYALLLAKFSGTQQMSILNASKSLKTGHRLLSSTLEILGHEAALDQMNVPINLLERIIAAVDVSALQKTEQDDPWLYFYEDFLAEYDPKMRKERGVYYTPVPVVQTQVRLVAELLATRFQAEFSFVDPTVITLDPAAGTGTYILTAIKHGLDQVAQVKGQGMRVNAATTAARNVHAFELLVGPYAVAHLRLTQQILKAGGTLPEDGVHVYLTDTLESPHAVPPGHLPLVYKLLGEEHVRAQKVKTETPVLVCLGNPPYDRQTIKLEDQQAERRKGGWIRFGDDRETGGLLKDFIEPLADAEQSVHAKNLYNDYVYFWRWALWKVFEAESKPGIVSFITASSYLRGPGFAGMRQVMRQTFDELWIIDLEGDNLGARKTANVFAIQTPVAIAIGVRYDEPRPQTPATVHYTRIAGNQAQKLRTLAQVASFASLTWRECLPDWTDPFLPVSENDYWRWPLLTDLFPWQENGVQFKRSWPIGESIEVLERRWNALLNAPKSQRGKLLRETDARKAHKTYAALDQNGETLPALATLELGTASITPTRYAYRSFDRHWVLRDNRLCDRPRPTLLRSENKQQIFMTSFLTNVLGYGPSAVATALIPDLDHFRGSFGAKHVIPLWRDSAGTKPNITHNVLALLRAKYAHEVSAESLLAYCYAVLFTPQYVAAFWDELTIPGPRVPLSKDFSLFTQAVCLGRNLIWLHTYGERCVPEGELPGRVPPGTARCKVGTPTEAQDYPEQFSYDLANQELHVGNGVFEHVRPEVWEFSVSGFEVVKSWLGYRMKKRSGKQSSPLDEIRPATWQFDEELLDLLWVLDHTIELLPAVNLVFEKILAGDLFAATDFPPPIKAERRGPKAPRTSQPAPLLDLVQK